MSAARTTLRSIGIAVALAVTAALLVALATAGGDSPHAAQSAEPAAERSAAAGRAAAAAEVALLRRPRAARDALPTDVLAGPLLADGALDLATARRAPTGRRAYVASSADGQEVCAVIDGGLGCTAVSALLDEGTSPSVIWHDPTEYVVFGVAADGVTDVELVDLDDRAQPVTVTDGFYAVESDTWPQRLTWTGPSGSASFDFPELS